MTDPTEQTVHVVTCCWSTLPCSVMVSAVFKSAVDAEAYVAAQEAMAANKGNRYVIWGRRIE